MKILVDLSPEHYDRILNEFSEETRMYAILKNGLVLHHFETDNESNRQKDKRFLK